jgi:hypothetical protein
MERWEYCTMEWLWDISSIRLNLADGRESKLGGGYAEVVQTLNSLGANGWDVTGCVATANWLFWTLKRRLPG